LKSAGFTIPKDWYADPKYTGLAWEAIYTLLTNEEPPEPQDQEQDEQGQGEGNDEDEGEQEDAPGDDTAPQEDEQEENGEGEAQGPAQPGNPKDAGGNVHPYPGKDGKPATEAELSEAAAELTDRIIRIQQAQDMAGTGSEGGRRIVDQLTTPKDPDLYDELAALLERAADNHTWRRLNKRLLHAGIFPGLDGEECPPLALVVDTSGSISDAIIAAFNDKVTRAIADFRPREITIIYCSDEIHGEPQTYTPDDFPELKPCGTGGTDFRPPFDWIDRNMLDTPAALVYLTDLEGIFPKEPPFYPVIWAAIPDYFGDRHTAPFGSTCTLTL